MHNSINTFTLEPGVMHTIEYVGHWKGSDIINLGPGAIWANWNGDAVIGSGKCLYLEEKWAYSIRVNRPIFNGNVSKLCIISDSAATVEVIKRESV